MRICGNESGNYVRVSEDKLVMIPLLEMCGTARARHIAAPIMIFNKIVDYSVGDPFAGERVQNAALIARRPPYARLAAKAVRHSGRDGPLIAVAYSSRWTRGRISEPKIAISRSSTSRTPAP